VGNLGIAQRAAIRGVTKRFWAKTNAGMGSLYRSQHELKPLFKRGCVVHVNNVELGKRGRWRSNVATSRGCLELRPFPPPELPGFRGTTNLSATP
jgi:hypothetical protein